MSHFTHIQTSFQNLSYLEKTLNRLDIGYQRKLLSDQTINLCISQKNSHDIHLKWNGKEYELIADISFWDQPYPINSFVDKLSKQYASEVIIGESQKIGFQSTESLQNTDGSNVLILERWS